MNEQAMRPNKWLQNERKNVVNERTDNIRETRQSNERNWSAKQTEMDQHHDKPHANECSQTWQPQKWSIRAANCAASSEECFATHCLDCATFNSLRVF